MLALWAGAAGAKCKQRLLTRLRETAAQRFGDLHSQTPALRGAEMHETGESLNEKSTLATTLGLGLRCSLASIQGGFVDRPQLDLITPLFLGRHYP